MSLRLIIYDDSCRGRFGQGLSTVWATGARLYRARGDATAARAVSDWQGAFDFLARERTGEPLDEIQFWGHGKWGKLFIGSNALDRSVFTPGHELAPSLAAVRARLSPQARFWFRTCETFGAARGHDFARAWTDYFGCAAAGHTYVIGFWQSGLHRLDPGKLPSWSTDEGLLEGSAQQPRRARTSSPREPNTIHCLDARFPETLG